MRLRAALFAVLALAGIGAAAWQIGVAATGAFERRTDAAVRSALAEAGQDWATAETDGLTVTIAGAAPDETGHLRAVEAVHRVVGAHRIADRSTIAPPPPPPPRAFAMELLRNRDDVSLIGLAPEPGTRARIAAALAGAGFAARVADMLETAEHPAPPGWDESLAFGLGVLTEMSRARIAVAPGEVAVTAVLVDDATRVATEARLAAAAPTGTALRLDLSAPRPGISPFRLDFRLDAGAGRLVACSAESADAAAEILAAARAARFDGGEEDCVLGLGAPSPDWAAVAARGIAALADLGGGGFALTDAEAELTGPPGIDPGALEAAGERLRAALPPGYHLATRAPPPAADPGAEPEVYAPRFDAVLGADGALELGGAVHDATSQAAILSYAAALFGHDQVRGETLIDPRLPEGWPVRVLAGIEALAQIEEGRLAVTPERIALSGRSLEADADARVEALLAAKAAGAASVVVRFDAQAAARAAEAARPAPERCAGEVAAILESESIVFRPGSAEIDPVSKGVIAAIADVLRACPGAEFEVAGHTDSSGQPEANQRLSEERAAAVAAALDAEAPLLIGLIPHGYGAARPRADNATPEGRALNRRIEIVLIDEARRTAEAEELAALAAAAGTAQAAPDGDACAAGIAAILEEDAIEFDLGSATISAESADVLAAVAEALAECGVGRRFEVGGHTDDRGPAGFNLGLSERRAEAVRTALADQGLDGVDLVARGYGAERPVADNGTQEGRARNRRIEITLVTDPAADAEAVEPAYGSQ